MKVRLIWSFSEQNFENSHPILLSTLYWLKFLVCFCVDNKLSQGNFNVCVKILQSKTEVPTFSDLSYICVSITEFLVCALCSFKIS